MQEVWEQLRHTTPIELVAMISGLLFPVFSAYEKKICWLFGGISAVLYVYIMFDANLYQDAVLSIFYVVMAIIGYLMWTGRIKQKNKVVKISRASAITLFVCVAIAVAYVFAGGFMFDRFTNADYPYTDAFIVGFSLVATWLDAKKKIENWIIFFIADAVAVWLFWKKGLILTSILNIVYCFICMYGIIQWRRKIKLSKLP